MYVFSRIFKGASTFSQKALYNFAITKPRDVLFDRLGGEVALTRVLDIFHSKVSNDKNLKDYFNEFPQQFKDHQRKTLRIAFGDPSGYTSRDIKSFHQVSHIKEKDWDNYVSYLRDSLSQVVGDRETVNEAVTIIQKFKKVVVEKTVFEKLNNNVALVKEVVGTLFDKMTMDSETKDFYLNQDLTTLKKKYVDYMVNLWGGAAETSYRDPRMGHKKMDLTDRHFYIFKKHLNDALRFHGVESSVIDEILFIVEKQRVHALNRKTSYELVGGDHGVLKIVDRLYELAPEHPLLKNLFEEVDIESVKRGQYKFFAGLLGGPKYVGKDLKTIYGKLNLADAHFDAFKSCFETVLRELQLKDDDIRDCTYQLEKHRRDICSINLFELLGGEPSVMRIVRVLAQKLRSSPTLRSFYDYADDDEMKAVLRAEIMYTLGGPLSFRGRDIRSAHAPLYISKEQFKEYKNLVFQSMKEVGVVDNLIVQMVRILENKSHYVICKHSKEDLKKQSYI